MHAVTASMYQKVMDNVGGPEQLGLIGSSRYVEHPTGNSFREASDPRARDTIDATIATNIKKLYPYDQMVPPRLPKVACILSGIVRRMVVSADKSKISDDLTSMNVVVVID